MSDRGMKKWNAYKSLPEHDPYIRNVEEEKYKVDRPIVSEEEAEIINSVLVHYHGQLLTIGYYRDREINYITSRIKKIDVYTKTILFEDRTIIKIKEIISLHEED